MTNTNEPPAGTPSNVRRFSIVRVPDRPKLMACEDCGTDYVGCPECERRQLIPNAAAVQFVTTQKFHHGRCHRHGQIWRRCSHVADTELLGDHAGARIERGRVFRLVIAFTVAAFWVGMLAGIAFVLLGRAYLAH